MMRGRGISVAIYKEVCVRMAQDADFDGRIQVACEMTWSRGSLQVGEQNRYHHTIGSRDAQEQCTEFSP